ncbi:MAG: CDP-alcohol phosphatidyltransferase family protein, partial [Isosphaeraceae bacterium]|nr:CDP-alcohol phosphatidyltransferase family protein [Isosphaeraceae bacterium]
MNEARTMAKSIVDRSGWHAPESSTGVAHEQGSSPTPVEDSARSTQNVPKAPTTQRRNRPVNEAPTLEELRARVHKDRHREIGNWLARRLARPAAVYGTWVAVRLGLSAHQVTLASLLASLGAAAAVASGSRGGFIAGAGLAALAFWLDRVDGQVARWRGTASLSGVYLDYLMHHAANLALGFALGYGLAARTGDPRWAIAGFAIAAGWALLSLHNDCRYKAFFQRLKREPGAFRVAGGSGGRPSP